MTVIPSILHTLTTLFRYTAPTLGKPEWIDLDKTLKRRLSPLHHHISLCENPADLAILGDLCTLEIRNFLEEHKDLFTDEDTRKKPYVPPQNKTLAELQNLKKVLRKKAFSVDGTQEERKQFHECLRAISYFKRQLSEKAKQKTSLHQEKQFNKNRWKFVKQAVNGTLGKEKKLICITPPSTVALPLLTPPTQAPFTGSHTFRSIIHPSIQNPSIQEM